MPASRHDDRGTARFPILERARLLVDSDYGREAGWDIELDGHVVGELSDPQWVDMFWYSYAVTEVSGSDGASSPIANDTLWNECRFCFRSRATGEVALHAFPGGSPPFVHDGRVLIRALYLVPSSRVESMLVWILSLSPRKPTSRRSSRWRR